MGGGGVIHIFVASFARCWCFIKVGSQPHSEHKLAKPA